jgi:hypothetical protein
MLKVLWSPYQKLSVWEGLTEIRNYGIAQNNVGYQMIIDLSDAGISAHPEKFQLELKGLVSMIYRYYCTQTESFFIWSGREMTRWSGLRHSVQSITAVEIDPLSPSGGAPS